MLLMLTNKNTSGLKWNNSRNLRKHQPQIWISSTLPRFVCHRQKDTVEGTMINSDGLWSTDTLARVEQRRKKSKELTLLMNCGVKNTFCHRTGSMFARWYWRIMVDYGIHHRHPLFCHDVILMLSSETHQNLGCKVRQKGVVRCRHLQNNHESSG